MALSSLGSLGLRCNFRLDMEEDLPKLKKDRQLPTGDFLDLIGGLFLTMKMGAGAKTGREHQYCWPRSQVDFFFFKRCIPRDDQQRESQSCRLLALTDTS